MALARAGWNVTVTGRREAELQETVTLLNSAAGRQDAGFYVSGDITKEDVVLRVFKETAGKFGRVDLVFCNAGISPPNVPLAEQKLSDWQATVDVNLTAPYLCAREAFRYMEKQQPQGGRIIINGSISAYAPRPFSSPYTATKTAMTGLTKSLSLDGRKFNIAVTQIDIGNAASEMTAKMKSGPGVPQVIPMTQNLSWTKKIQSDRSFSCPDHLTVGWFLAPRANHGPRIRRQGDRSHRRDAAWRQR